ncbi:MAG TPA: hypothetical protein VHA06_23545 [Candidatus Angelobacter sp.]|nr:hypothetical protein [Candidatus Angelobacter sp.]
MSISPESSINNFSRVLADWPQFAAEALLQNPYFLSAGHDWKRHKHAFSLVM